MTQRLTRRLTLAGGAAAGLMAPWLASAGVGRILPRGIILRNEVAMGGERAWRQIQSLESVVRIVEQGAVVLGRYRASKRGRARIDVFAGATRVFSEGVDEDGSWQWPGGASAPEASPAAAKGILERGIDLNLNSLRGLADAGATFAAAPEAQAGNERYVALKRVLKDGHVDYLYFDPQDWLVKRQRDVRAIHPAVSDTKKPLENQYDDYRLVQGVRTPFQSRQVDLTTGVVLQTTTVLRQAYNLAEQRLDLNRAYVPGAPPVGG